MNIQFFLLKSNKKYEHFRIQVQFNFNRLQSIDKEMKNELMKLIIKIFKPQSFFIYTP